MYAKLRKHKTLSYGSEAEVQNLVSMVLEDLVDVLGWSNDLEVRLELSINGLRADLWLVLVSGRPVGVVEVKKPGGELSDLLFPQ